MDIINIEKTTIRTMFRLNQKVAVTNNFYKGTVGFIKDVREDKKDMTVSYLIETKDRKISCWIREMDIRPTLF